MPTSALGLSYVQSTILLIAAGTVLLFMLVVASFKLSSEASNKTEAISVERLVRIATRQAQIGLIDAETGQRGYLLTGDEAYLKPYTDGERSAREGLAAMRERITHPDDIKRLADIENYIDDKLEELKTTVELTKTGRRDEAIAIMQTDRGRDYMNELRADFDAITARSDSAIGEGLESLDKSAGRLSMTTAFGSMMLVSFAALAFYIVANNTGKLISAQESLRELTNDLEDRVKDRTQSLTEANEEIQRFAYIVSHDLRAPLVNIMGFTSELESASGKLAGYFSKTAQDIDEPAAAQIAMEDIPESVGFIRASSVKMDGLIGAILKLSREGRREFKRERVQFDEVVQTALASLQHQLDETSSTVDVDPELPSVVSDKIALEQIVGNILENAVKYLMPGRPGKITVTGEESGGRVKLRIADNGRGVAENDLKRIFDLFRRAGRPDRPGEGIGLAHVRSLVRALGGDVTVQSKLGEGTTFTIDLPKKIAVRANKEQPA